MSADPQNAIKGQVTDSEGAVIAKSGVRYRFLIPFLGVSSSTTQCFGSALARDQKTFVVMFDLPSAGIYHVDCGTFVDWRNIAIIASETTLARE